MENIINNEVLNAAMSYQTYTKLIEDLLAQGKTTGNIQNEEYLKYTELNFHRMKRLDKTSSINNELKEVLQKIKKPLVWLVLSEAWCGDAAQNLPLLNKMTEENAENISLKIILRDENLAIMDKYLTNGGRSIPKLIILKKDTLEEIATWGPRPEPIQKLMQALKTEGIKDYKIIAEKVQRAYNEDKNNSIQAEFLQLLENNV
ncbi:MAG: thioredoxin family protein [Thermonemataceae bacterium]|nr:thioredoxin family protein [Thermonemataceae bacterium]